MHSGRKRANLSFPTQTGPHLGLGMVKRPAEQHRWPFITSGKDNSLPAARCLPLLNYTTPDKACASPRGPLCLWGPQRHEYLVRAWMSNSCGARKFAYVGLAESRCVVDGRNTCSQPGYVLLCICVLRKLRLSRFSFR